MKTTQRVPTFQEALDRIQPIITGLYEAAEKAAQSARMFFDQEADGAVDPYLFPNLFRFHAKRYLDALGHEVKEFGRDSLPNNGLLVRFNGFHLRILKAQNKGVPPPGQSESKQAYYCQQLALPYSDAATPGLNLPIDWNLLVIWDVTKEYVLRDLQLGLPKIVLEDDFLMHWVEPIPHPVLAITQSAPISEEPHQDDLDDLTRRRDQKIGDGDES